MKKSTIAIIVVVLVGIGYAYTYFQVKEAASNVLSSAEAVDFQLENISLLPPSADVTLYYRVYNPSAYGFTVYVKYDMYVGENYITTFIIEDEFVKAYGEGSSRGVGDNWAIIDYP